ncbi:MAG TPA: hypothetical protein VJ809_08840 [Pirellulales bacterium]|nr:hypothetical protein [Pirellulales bacterium]
MKEELVGVSALLLILIVGALFGRLHGGGDGAVKAIGDRVACGLLALPLISIAVHLAIPGVHLGWVLAAPTPLFVYVVLLACTDLKSASPDDKSRARKAIKNNFTAALVIGIAAIYVVMVACILVFGIATKSAPA